MDFTVSTPTIVSALYAHIPSNGSELVLFDVNSTIKFGPLLRPGADTALARLLPVAPQSYRTTIITTDADGGESVERTIETGRDNTHTRDAEVFGSVRCQSIKSDFPKLGREQAAEANKTRLLSQVYARGTRSQLQSFSLLFL